MCRLEHDADFLAKAQAQRFTPIANRAAGRLLNPFQHLDCGGLTRAVGAEQAETAPRRNGEIEAIDRLDSAKMFDEMMGFQQGGHKAIFHKDHTECRSVFQKLATERHGRHGRHRNYFFFSAFHVFPCFSMFFHFFPCFSVAEIIG